jgi:fructose-1,6-bisphosphatase/inositol monophosphatase family enzyme
MLLVPLPSVPFRPVKAEQMSVLPDMDAIVVALRNAAETAILPRFRTLEAADIHDKGKDDLVTIADREAEILLTQSLPALLPGSVVVGEEAAAADATIMERLDGDAPVWLVDPVDGTSNFVAGKEAFGVMAALVFRGEPVLSVIYAPISGRIVTAEKGSGAYIDGQRLTGSDDADTFSTLRGAVMTHYMPKAVAALLTEGAAGLGERLKGLRACAFEYPAIAKRERDFAVFSKTMPWDHAPGAVIMAETGGVMRFLDGSPYTPRRRRAGLLVARNAAIWETAAAGLFPDGDPFRE